MKVAKLVTDLRKRPEDEQMEFLELWASAIEPSDKWLLTCAIVMMIDALGNTRQSTGDCQLEKRIKCQLEKNPSIKPRELGDMATDHFPIAGPLQ